MRAEHAEQLRTPTLGIYFASIARKRRFMQCETGDLAVYSHFLHGSIEAVFIFLFFGGGVIAASPW